MSTHDRPNFRPSASDPIRDAFRPLSMEEKISTLIHLNFDLMGDIADRVIDAASQAADELRDLFERGSRRATPPEPGTSPTS